MHRYIKYGYYQSNNSYVFNSVPEKTAKLFKDLRNEGKYFLRFGNHVINRIRDLTEPFDSSNENFLPTLPIILSVQMIT